MKADPGCSIVCAGDGNARSQPTTNEPNEMLTCTSLIGMSACPLIRCQLACCGAIRQDQGCTTAYASGWNRLVPFAQPHQHLCLLRSRYRPEHESRAVEDRISECHP